MSAIGELVETVVDDLVHRHRKEGEDHLHVRLTLAGTVKVILIEEKTVARLILVTQEAAMASIVTNVVIPAGTTTDPAHPFSVDGAAADGTDLGADVNSPSITSGDPSVFTVNEIAPNQFTFTAVGAEGASASAALADSVGKTGNVPVSIGPAPAPTVDHLILVQA